MFIYHVVLFQTRWFMFTRSSSAVQGGSCDTSRVHLTYYRNNDFAKKVKPAPVHGIQVFPKICHQDGCSAEQICHPEHRNWPRAKAVAGTSRQLLTTASWPQPFRGTLPSILLEGNSWTGAIPTYFYLTKKNANISAWSLIRSGWYR